MAALTRWIGVIVAAIVAAIEAMGCVDLPGLEAGATPLARLNILVIGDPAAVAAPDDPEGALFAILRWGWEPRVPDPFCVLAAESEGGPAVIAAGCPDDAFGFMPTGSFAGERVAVTPGVVATLDLMTLPEVDDLVGDGNGRVAYGSLIVGKTDGEEGATPYFYGASFLSMTQPDQRLAYREGAFDGRSTFYPRVGCAPPPEGFSVLSASGFSREAAVAAALAGTLPEQQDRSQCRQESPDEAVITIRLQPARPFVRFLCGGGNKVYDGPPSISPLADNRPWACVSVGGDRAVTQLVVAFDQQVPDAGTCGYLSRYLLRGCHLDPTCATPDWDQTASPPAWWPCKVAP